MMRPGPGVRAFFAGYLQKKKPGQLLPGPKVQGAVGEPDGGEIGIDCMPVVKKRPEHAAVPQTSKLILPYGIRLTMLSVIASGP